MQHQITTTIFFLALVVGGFISPRPLYAQAVSDTSDPSIFHAEVPIFNLFTNEKIDNDLTGKYIRAIYVSFIWVLGILATIMVIYAGIKWIAAAGDAGQIRDAKDMINNAIVGIIIGLTSVILLNTIDNRFTHLSIPTLGPVTRNFYTGALVPEFCSPKIEVSCGQLKKIYTSKDAKENTVDVYCAGTACNLNQVCVLNPISVPVADRLRGGDWASPPSTYYQPQGCVSSVPLAPSTGSFASISSLEVDSDPGATINFSCGQASAPKKKTGTQCPTPASAFFNDKGICYIIGLPGQVVDNPADANKAKLSHTGCPVI